MWRSAIATFGASAVSPLTLGGSVSVEHELLDRSHATNEPLAPMTKPVALLLEGIHPVATPLLEQAGFEVRSEKSALKSKDLANALQGVTFLGIRSKTHIDALAVSSSKDLLAIGAFCIGTNQVDLKAAMRAGVAVFNAPFSNTRSVAELVMAEIVMLARELGDRVREMHEGRWRKTASGAREVRGKTLGIVGYGHIGRQVGVLAEAFGMRVLFYDVSPRLAMGNNESSTELEGILKRADFVTLHVPATPQTVNMIGEKELAMLKPGACLINASRGNVVELGALAAAMKSGRVAGAAIDVFPEEPEESSTDSFRAELQGLKNVIMTPHIGGSTLEAQEAIGREVAATLTKYFRTGSTAGSVNFPQVELAPAAPSSSVETHRLVHVHKNVPGVLRDVNKVVSDFDANVQAQVLSTNEEIGYLLMDIERARAAPVCDALGKIETTIRTRNLT